MIDINEKALALILAGGGGSRLHPLTEHRAKPAVPFGGKYRIIDFTLSNCLHSRLRRILVFTQYKSHSLQNHLRDGWSVFNPSIGEYITPVPPQMRTSEFWYRGTADAVFQNFYLIERSGADYIVILSGDHIYRMDYTAMLESHCDSGAGVTVGCMEVPIDKASQFGVVGIDESNRILKFEEKPKHPTAIPGDPDHALVSMGIYVFSRELLFCALQKDQGNESSSLDFGKDILPALTELEPVCGYRFGGHSGRVTADRYWRDVGTIDSYYETNMELLEPVPAMDLYQKDWPIRTFESQSPPARTVPGESGQEAELVTSIICSGTVISGGSVRHSILGPSVRVEDHALVEASILFEGVRVGSDARIQNCIVDKFVQVPAGESIGFDSTRDAERFTLSKEGVYVVPKDYRFTV